jgi:hypothetical protein
MRLAGEARILNASCDNKRYEPQPPDRAEMWAEE